MSILIDNAIGQKNNITPKSKINYFNMIDSLENIIDDGEINIISPKQEFED